MLYAAIITFGTEGGDHSMVRWSGLRELATACEGSGRYSAVKSGEDSKERG